MAENLWFWNILGIEPTKDKTVIKRSFSKLAHEKNPEDDPEGYAKLHDAYKEALNYASEKIVVVSENGNTVKENQSAYDFSSVNDDDRPLLMTIAGLTEEIRRFKIKNNVYTYENLFQKPVSELHEITISLFKLYAALAFKTDNMNVWTAFFNEPLITIVLEEPDLRSFLIDYFPEGDVNRATIAGFISSYEDNLTQKIEKEKLEKERKKEEEQALQKKQGIWIYLAVASSILFIVLITMPSDINLPESQIITIGCMILSFGLGCLSRHLKIYAKREKSRKKIILSRILIVAVIISISIGWISFFSENTSDGIYTYVSLACCLMFTAISIITVLLDSNPIERIKRALHGK